MSLAGAADSRRPRSPLTRFVWGGIALLLSIALLALGIWQLERRVWKLDLIEKIDQRIHAPATDAPGPATWSSIDASRDTYRRIRTEGAWLADRDTLVQAVTVRGAGFWVLTPLQTDAGFTVLVNRGFTPTLDSKDRTAATGRGVVTGLLRMPEPHGGFLRANDPATDRWFSRDVAAIGHVRGLADNAPYFLDADRTSETEFPVGGLTVIDFPNNHLVYAITWFTLAAMVLGAGIYVVREGRKIAP